MPVQEAVATPNLNQAEIDKVISTFKSFYSKDNPAKMASPIPGVERLYVGGYVPLSSLFTVAGEISIGAQLTRLQSTCFESS